MSYKYTVNMNDFNKKTFVDLVCSKQITDLMDDTCTTITLRKFAGLNNIP
jgi:hypothetical protein